MTELLTLNAIRAQEPSPGIWRKLLAYLGKTAADDAPLSMLTVLDSNGLDDALWCLRCVKGRDGAIRLLACDFAQSVAHFNADPRVQAAIDVARRYAVGNATVGERWMAYGAAYDAAWDARAAAEAAARAAAYAAADAAASDAAWAAAYAAADAAEAAAEAAYDAAHNAVWAARYAAYAATSDVLTAILQRWIAEQEAAEAVDDARLKWESIPDSVTPSWHDGWREIDDDMPPTLERVIVSGWRPRSPSGTAGYWWVHEDHTDEFGRPMCHPGATLWQPMPQTPRRPEPKP